MIYAIQTSFSTHVKGGYSQETEATGQKTPDPDARHLQTEITHTRLYLPQPLGWYDKASG